MTGVIWRSAFVAAFFALHPLHVESVAWIAERKDVLSAFFWMLTLCFYVRYTEKPVIRRYLLVLFSFILALMSKPMVVTLPAIMILLDYWPLRRFQSTKGNFILWQLKEKMSFFVLSAIIIVIVFYNPNAPNVKQVPLIFRLANSPVSFMTYLEKTFWPHDMAVFYPFPAQIPAWQVLFASLVILFISAVVIATVKRLPYLFVGWLWYVITIAPVIGIVQVSVNPYAMADRYHYLPSIGMAVMLAWGMPFLIKNKQTRKKILFPAGTTFLFVMVLLAWQQCGYWKNNITLYNHTLRVTKDNVMAYINLGVALFAEGEIEEAIDNYSKALRITPGNVPSYNHRGIAYATLGQYQLAIEDFNEAIRLEPKFAQAYNNRGGVYLLQGSSNLGCSDAQKACALGVCKALELAKGKGKCR
jgi:hypothetical protein